MVRDGVADIGFVTFGESSNVFPDTSVFELPFLTRTSLEGSLAHWRLHRKMEMAGYGDFHWLSLNLLPPYQFHFAKPIQGLDSLKNLKVRSGGHVQTQIVELLGMTPVSGPVTSSAEALSRGTWDGIFIEWSAGNVFGVHKVAKYHYEMNIASIALGIAMNKKVYDSMDAASRKAIDDLSGEKQTRDIGILWDNDREDVIRQLNADKDQVTVRPTDAELAKAKKAMEPIVDEWLKSSPRNKMVLDNVTQVLNDIRK
jgi:TRAP-type C4-dicarboxylate transport system substrate-binding protein